MVVLLILLSVAAAPHAQLPTWIVEAECSDPWVTVHDEGRRLHVERGRLIRFEGVGRLAFGTDRQDVRVETDPPAVFVNGAPADGQHTVAPDETLELRGVDGTRWVIRLASKVEVEAVVDATRIRDARPERPAHLDTDEHTVFFLHVDERGGSTFIYPEAAP